MAGAARRNRVEVSQATLRDLASEIEWAKVSNVRPDDYERLAPRAAARSAASTPGTVAHVFGSYEELKRDQGRMDMEDVLLIAAALLSEDERVAAEVRRQYKWFVVDEFQDVSPIQSALLDLWLGGRDEICVVGDPAQTIYSFAGAQAAYLDRLPARVPRCHQRRAGPQLPLHPAGDRGGQHAAQGLGDHRACSCGPSARPARRCGGTRRTDEVDEAQAVAERDRPVARRRACRCARWPCCSASTRSPRPSRRR